MKQLELELLDEEDGRLLSILLDRTVEDELLSFMGQAIIRVLKQGGCRGPYC